MNQVATIMSRITKHQMGISSAESVDVVFSGKFYRVTGSPTIATDKHSMVEVLVSETTQRRRHFRHPDGMALFSDRPAHYRRLRCGPKKSAVIAATVAAMS